MVFDHLLHASAVFVLSFVGALTVITTIAFVLLLRPSTTDRRFPFVLLDVALSLALLLTLSPLYLILRLMSVATSLRRRVSYTHSGDTYRSRGQVGTTTIDTTTRIGAVLHLCMLDRLPAVVRVLTGDVTLKQALTPSSHGHERDRVDERISNFVAIVAVAAACWTLFVALDASSFRSTVVLTVQRATNAAAGVYAATRTSASLNDFIFTALKHAHESPFFLLMLIMPAAWLVTLVILACGLYLRRNIDTIAEAALVFIPMCWFLLLYLGGLISSIAGTLANVVR